MKANLIKPGKRVYHAIFGWCEITHPPTNMSNDSKTLVDLEADEIEYYVVGKGYVRYSRDVKSKKHILFTPITDLFEDDKNIPSIFSLKKAALNPKIIFWNK